MDFFSKLAPIIFSSDPVAVPDYLVECKLLPESCECIHCNKPMVLRKRPTKDTTDGYGWQCIYGQCPKRLTRTIRAGTFFEKSRLPLAKLLYLMYLWSQDTMVKNAAETTGISQDSGTDVPILQGRLQHQTYQQPSPVRRTRHRGSDRRESL